MPRKALAILPFLLLAPLRADDPPAKVTTVVAEKTDGIVREFSLTGSVTARRDARLSSRIEGLVAEVAVDAGSLVKPGDHLLTLDTKLAEIALDSIRADIAQAEVALAEAIRREEEVQELSRNGGFAKSEAETRKSERRIAEAALQKLRVAETQQQERIERHRVIAPFAGVIGEKLAEAGEWVQTGTPVLHLVETESPRFDIRVPQEFLTRLSATEEVSVTLDSFPGVTIPATVAAMVPVKESASRTFLTRLELKDPEHLAAPGMSGSATIRYRSEHRGAVQIPRDAVMRYPDGTAKVWVVAPSGSAETVSARTILTDGSLGEITEVIEGLEGGERVVLRGNEALREGQAVQTGSPQPETSAP